MNRIVRENYAVADLPEDLRSDLADVQRVRVVLEPLSEPSTKTRPSLDELFARARPGYASFQDVVDHIEALRADWD